MRREAVNAVPPANPFRSRRARHHAFAACQMAALNVSTREELDFIPGILKAIATPIGWARQA